MTEDDTHPDSTAADESFAPEKTAAARYLGWVGVGAFALLGIVAVFRFYTYAARAVSLWVAPAYEPLFQAGFNLVVVLVAASAIALLLSSLRELPD